MAKKFDLLFEIIMSDIKNTKQKYDPDEYRIFQASTWLHNNLTLDEKKELNNKCDEQVLQILNNRLEQNKKMGSDEPPPTGSESRIWYIDNDNINYGYSPRFNSRRPVRILDIFDGKDGQTMCKFGRWKPAENPSDDTSSTLILPIKNITFPSVMEYIKNYEKTVKEKLEEESKDHFYILNNIDNEGFQYLLSKNYITQQNAESVLLGLAQTKQSIRYNLSKN